MTMKKIIGIALALLVSTAAHAADNAIILTPGSGVTMRSIDIGAGVQAPGHALVDASGAQLGVSGAPLYIRGASAAFASGSFSSGAFASGSYASGAFAAGSMVDLLTMRGTVAAGTAASNSLLTGCIYNSTPITLTNGQGAAVQCNASGYPNVVVTNTNANGRATAANSSPVVPVAAASTAGAIQPNNTTAVVVKGSAGTLFGIQLGGIGSAPAYVKIYNATSATCGSGTPVKRLIIPAAATAANGAGSNITFSPGLAFSTGITYCVTTGIGDSDTTAAAASTFLINFDYE